MRAHNQAIAVFLGKMAVVMAIWWDLMELWMSYNLLGLSENMVA